MKRFLGRTYGRLLTSGMQLFLIALLWQAQSRTAAIYCLPLVALISLLAWLSALKRRNFLVSIPVAKIVSAAQGYLQLAGRGRPLEGAPLYSPSGAPCLWYRTQVRERPVRSHINYRDLLEIFFALIGADAHTIRDESSDPFILDDGTGRCTVMDIEQAEMLCSNKTTRWTISTTTTEWRFNLNEPLYVLGDFKTIDAHTFEFNARAEVSNLLAEWKKDPVSLNKRFDLDGNNQLNEKEWNLARSAARRAVEKERDESLSQPAAHFIHSPASGEVYLISNISPAKLAFRYLLWSVFHLLVFMGAMGSIPWIIGHL